MCYIARFPHKHKEYYIKVEKKPKIKKQPKLTYWTDEEKDAFVNVLKEHGKNYKKLLEALPNKSINRLYSYACRLQKEIERDPNHKYADFY